MPHVEDVEDDVKDEAKSVLRHVMGSISKSSNTKQLLLGTGSGLTAGYLTMKIGKATAFAVGGGILLLQIAQTQGYVRIDWDRIRRKATKTSRAVEDNISSNKAPAWVDEVKKFLVKNSCFAGGFLGGFFIGISV